MPEFTLTVIEQATVVETVEQVNELVTENTTPVVIETPIGQGPPGRDGTDGAEISAEAGNQLQKRDDGLYVGPLSWDTNNW